eukprot:2129080-Rhodomonas_salina.3
MPESHHMSCQCDMLGQKLCFRRRVRGRRNENLALHVASLAVAQHAHRQHMLAARAYETRHIKLRRTKRVGRIPDKFPIQPAMECRRDALEDKEMATPFPRGGDRDRGLVAPNVIHTIGNVGWIAFEGVDEVRVDGLPVPRALPRTRNGDVSP